MATPRTTILSHIPVQDRAAFFSSLVSSLHPDDRSGIDFVASAVVGQGDDEALGPLLAFLSRSIETGELAAATQVAEKHPVIGGKLFTSSAASLSRNRGGESSPDFSGSGTTYHLRFCKAALSCAPNTTALKEVLSASLDLLRNADQNIRNSARDLVFAAFLDKNDTAVQEAAAFQSPDIWKQVRGLAFESDKHSRLLAYALWLRWLLFCENSKANLSDQPDDTYWDLILNGLRRGDAEMRKLCLNILKLSLNASDVQRDTQMRLQFERYATVFETIVLGRYINQIQECEGDLDELATPTNSLVGSKWLYALLASGLDSQMQESNRRFIGSWVMKASLCTGVELAAFVRDDFLPWATQGSLFVASLKNDERGNASCPHGERLASYVSHILNNTTNEHYLSPIIWDCVTNKKTFPYAKVWLLKALVESVQSPQDARPWLASDHNTSEQILRGLPDAAREYVTRQLAKLGVPLPSESKQSHRDVLETNAIDKCSRTASAEDLDDLWSDLDYLEFPKNLLLHIPGALLSRGIVDEAMRDQNVRSSLRERIRILQKVAETKTYLLAPLNAALRGAVLQIPQAFALLGLGDYIIGAVDHPPEPTIDLMLEESTVHLFAEYEGYFGRRPSYGIVALLDLVSRTSNQEQLRALIEELLRRWKAQRVPPPTVSSWKTTLQLQTLLLCLENLKPSAEGAKDLVMDLLRILSIEPLPRYRYLLEWMIVRLLQRMQLEDLVLEQLASKDHHGNPKYLASLMKIGSIIGCSASSNETFGIKLATLFVPLAASSKIVIRHEAQWQVPMLLEHARTQGWTAVTENTALAALDDYIRSLERFHEPPLERKIGRFDPETHHTLANLLDGPWFGLDSTESPLASRQDFADLDREDDAVELPARCMPLGEAVARETPALVPAEAKARTASKPAPRTIDDVTALQTKGTAYLARTLSNPSASAARPNNLIVVGSLVDNPYNLGGLSRVSEIFGASALTLQNQNVIGNKDFTAVSVSSHLHFPIVQLSAPGVPAFLAERKAEGFTVVGIEQTDRSVILGSTEAKLPEKCVLVVGSEKEGIPAVVLTECDVLVEIPQKGVTRSLNVQTAVSVVLFEYARQHGGKA